MNEKFLFFLSILIIFSPIFGVILADMVGYHEPLDLVAQSLGLQDVSEEINWTHVIRERIEINK